MVDIIPDKSPHGECNGIRAECYSTNEPKVNPAKMKNKNWRGPKTGVFWMPLCHAWTAAPNAVQPIILFANRRPSTSCSIQNRFFPPKIVSNPFCNPEACFVNFLSTCLVLSTTASEAFESTDSVSAIRDAVSDDICRSLRAYVEVRSKGRVALFPASPLYIFWRHSRLSGVWSLPCRPTFDISLSSLPHRFQNACPDSDHADW